MNLIDSSAWLEYLADGPDAGYFAAAVEDDADFDGLPGVRFRAKRPTATRRSRCR